MFLDEAKLAAQIIHPNVAAVHEIGEEQGLLFMVGELVQGESLKTLQRRLVAEGTQLSQPMAAYIASAICSGLHAAHELQDQDGRPYSLVHRDVSPQNVLIGYNGFIKLIDFGVAQAKGRLSHTEAGTIKGKMGYLSPEQLKSEKLDRRSDLFSLGVVLYQMLIGKHPFPGETNIERLNRISAGQYIPPCEENADIAPELARIVTTALSVRREDRFPSAASMSETLNAYIRSQSETAGPRRLATIMERLFATQITVHRDKLRAWRERGEGVGPLPFVVESAALPGSQEQGGEREVASETSVEMAKHRRASVVRWLAGGAIAAALLAAAVVLYAVADSDGAEQDRAPGDPKPGAVDATGSTAETPVDRETAPDQASEVRFTFEVSPERARISLDGEALPVGAHELTLPADGENHAVKVEASGFKPQEFELTADRDRTIPVILAQLGKKKGKRQGKRKGGAATKEPDKPVEKKKVLKESPY